MKIELNEIKEIPSNIGEGFCIYGKPSDKIKDWIKYHNFDIINSGNFTNILIPKGYDLYECFNIIKTYKWVDGFSPNLNKHLHLGHISNFVLAKAFQKMNVGENYLANLGDTLEGEVSKNDAYIKYLDICKTFDYSLDKIYFASELSGVDNLLIDGSEEYEGTKIFNINDTKVVGKKSSGLTTYFYQDVALANLLNDNTLYLTGFEQSSHFKILKELYPQVNHLPLGLVIIKGKKMSSRDGNVIYLDEIIKMFKDKFGDNDKLVWNVLAGYILKSSPGTIKNIDFEQLDNVKLSSGLYLSYTLAKLKSSTLEISDIKDFNSNNLKYKYLKSKNYLQPNILFEGLVELAKKLSKMYEILIIKGNEENKILYQPLAQDLLYGMKILGMFDIDHV